MVIFDSEDKHTPECNYYIRKFRECYAEYKYAKFVGKCDDYDQLLRACLKKEKFNILKETAKKVEERKRKQMKLSEEAKKSKSKE